MRKEASTRPQSTHPVEDGGGVVSSSGVGDESPESSNSDTVDGKSRLVAVSEDLGSLSIDGESVES